MSVAPAILTQPVLTQREAQPVCMIQSEEILRVKTPAYAKSNSDISFMVRQPSGSAILTNDVEILLEAKFTLSHTAIVRDKYIGGLAANGANYLNLADTNSDFGFMPEMLPLQNKCIRNAVITINGSSQSIRCNEFGKPYCMMHCSRPYMEKIGGGINDYSRPSVFTYAAAGVRDKPGYAQNASDAKQYSDWKLQMTQDHSQVDGVAALTNGALTTPTFQFQESLFIGPFGAFQQCESFPAWSSESQKSPGLLHVHNMQLQFALEDNWQNSLYLQCYNYTRADGNMAEITGVEIVSATLMTKWVLPPPRLVSAALTQQVSYASFDVLRFVAEPAQGANIIHDGGSTEFTLNAVSFPYMPSIFIFEIAPHYAHASKFIGMRTQDHWCLENMKKDKRCAISHMDLSINTSSAAIPYKGGPDNAQTHRVNARDLYKMTLENCASFENFAYSFTEWYENCGFVAVTPAQLSGVLNSPNIRGSVVLQGTVYMRNLCGCPVNVSRANQIMAGNDAAAGVVYDPLGNVPRYQCIVSGVYTNRNLVLDAKSGILSESTFSQAFAQQLRLGAGGA